MIHRAGRLLTYLVLVPFLAAHVLPVHRAVAAPQAASLGTARGVKVAEQSYGGARWLPLGGRSLPVLADTRIRTAAGGAVVDLVDGTRIGVLPFSTAAIRSAGDRLEVTLERGRLTFRWPATSRAVIQTPAARLAPRPGEAAAGEVSAGASTGVRLASGRIDVVDLTTRAPVLVASRQPIVLPAVAPGVRVFAADDEPLAARSGRPVFGPQGDSVGYLEDPRTLVVHPGFAADLTAPFPSEIVRRAMAAIPPERQPGAMPLFDVDGDAVGYVSGPAFYPMTAQAGGSPVFQETLPDEGWPWYYYAAAAVAAGGIGVGIAAAAGGGGGGGSGGGDAPASPLSP